MVNIKKIKSITNISTVGELKKFLRGIPDDIKIVTNDGESSYSEPISLEYFPKSRTFKVRVQCDEDALWFKNSVFDVEFFDVQ